MTAIADFEQRWRQRGKTPDCSFKQAGTRLKDHFLSKVWNWHMVQLSHS